ncbi:MAG: hypothetical protein A4E19_13655 [Nitrospira sp. SG-bin1]|nr:MAG: hypothetical protein A4E19_13655 [Nitrospira sp. SG-bin1]
MRVRSFDEYWVRGKQEINKVCERLLGLRCFELSDQQFLKRLQAGKATNSVELAAVYIRERIAATKTPLFASWGVHQGIRDVMSSRFSGVAREIIERADRCCAYQFDLLGHKDLWFGSPVDWHLEPLSRVRAPLHHWTRVPYLDHHVVGDKKIIWELNRHQFIVTLGQAYRLTSDERYAETFVKLISSWMDANLPKRGINWVSSLELAFRIISWLWALHLFVESTALTTPFVVRMLKYLVAQGHHVETYLSYYFSPNTHLTGEALGLFYLGSTLPELCDAKRWRAVGLKILLQQIQVQVKEDGVHFEQASYYHRYTTDFYLHFYIMARAQGVSLPDLVEQKLKLLLDHLMWIGRPDGSSPYIGDDDGGVLLSLGVRPRNDFRDTLALGATLFKNPRWKYLAGRDQPELLWLLGSEGVATYDDLESMSPAELAKQFSDGGYFVMRSGWSDRSSHLLIDCGPHGTMNCGHAHADALSFEYSASGVTWVVDPGTYTYTGDVQLRDYFRSTRAHNTLTVDDLSQSTSGGPFSWSTIGTSQAKAFIETSRWLCFRGQHEGYRRLTDPVTHTRTSALGKSEPDKHPLSSCLILHDRLDARKAHRYASYLHFSPACHVTSRVDGAYASTDAGQELLIVTAVSDDRGIALTTQTRKENSWVSPCYGFRVEAPVLVTTWKAIGTCTCVTMLMPHVIVETQTILRVVEEIEETTDLLHIPKVIVRMLEGALQHHLRKRRSTGSWTTVK